MQNIIVTDPENTAFLFDPRWKELRIVNDVNLVLDKSGTRFEIDRTPSEDANLVPVDDLRVRDDFSGLAFSVRHEEEQISFSIASPHRFDRVLYRTIGFILEGAFSFDQRDEDSISILGKHGGLSSMIIRKAKDPTGPYVNMFFDNDSAFKIIEVPHARLRVSEVRWLGDALAVRTEDGADQIYKFSSQAFIVETVGQLLATRLQP
ncbi:MAG TPA: hypothetical protein VFP68_09760 [Burkholderiaceae bacterium]|nr:hypothetical protein [Burkholderiaceae bacterium]